MICPFKGQFDWYACEEKRVAISDLKEELFQERIWSLKFNFYVLNSLLLTLTHTWGQIPLYRCEPYSHTSCLQKIAFDCCNHEISQAFNYWAVYSIFQLLCVLIYINVHPPRYLSMFSLIYIAMLRLVFRKDMFVVYWLGGPYSESKALSLGCLVSLARRHPLPNQASVM